ncbi:MAG: response regulator [Nitrospirae bacterium]|nr:response regulator [Nitrospirota bacterium]
MKAKILLAEDEKVQLEALKVMLDSRNFSLTGAKNGVEALTELRENFFDLLITDMKMPKMNGIELIKESRKIQPDLPVIIITGFADMELAMEALNLGAEGLFKKPPDREKLISKIKQCMDKRRLREALLQSAKMSSLGEWTVAITHELRNILGAIGIYGNILQKFSSSYPECQRCKEPSKVISGSIERADRTIDYLLNFSRPSGKKGIINLERFFDSILSLMDDKVKYQNIVIERKIGDMVIKGVEDSLNIIFLNLITNAIQAMDKGGSLRIFARQNSKIEIEVSDTGCGIPPDIQEKIFDIFFTTKKGGNGLGLALVKNEVEKIGGEILLTSEHGKGSTFTVRLPQ